MAAMIGTSMVFDHFNQGGRGGIAAASVGVLLGVLLISWNARRTPGFWSVVAIFSLLHAVMVFGPPWSGTDVSMYVLFPFAIVDGVIFFSVLNFLERRNRQGP